MFDKILPKQSKQALEILSGKGVLENFYLAGGTALALHLGHRLSEDLDFFTPEEINTQQLIQKLKVIGSFLLIKEDWGTVVGEFNGARISFFTYKYPLLKPLKSFAKIKLADIIDIAGMKISAISSRGSKRDFIDLYLVCKNVASLEELLKNFREKYKKVNYSHYHILRSLSYFDDAEEEFMPEMLVPLEWEEVKQFFEKEVKKIGSTFLQ